jgi:hypothetical protein
LTGSAVTGFFIAVEQPARCTRGFNALSPPMIGKCGEPEGTVITV